MTKEEALNLALEFIEQINKYGWKYKFEAQMYEAINAIKEALAQPEQEPMVKLQMPTVERAWFTIAELNAWADKKLLENPQWVMPKDEPERPLQRKWRNLQSSTINALFCRMYGDGITDGGQSFARAIEAKLKEKNFD
jgi:hypothetical protein